MSNDYNGIKRSELPDSVFGIPQERKYPMPDEKHTRSAIKLFNHVDPKYEEQLAKAVIKNMKKYGIDGSAVGPNNRLKKYLPKDMIKESTIIPPICSFEKESIHEYKPIPGSGIQSVIRPISQKDKNDIQHIMNNLDGFKDFVFKNICFYDIERHNQTPIGFVILRKSPELHKAFVSIGVTEEYRGSGIGSKLLKKAISYFKSTKDLIWLEYWVDVNNQASIALAEKSGFTKYLSNNTSRSSGYYKYYMKNDNNLYEQIQESSHKSDFSYSGIKTSAEKSEFKRDFREVFKEDPTESSINYMQMIKYKGSLVGYIGFSRYKECKKKYLGIGNFMIIKRYQHSGIGTKVISDIIDRYKDNYDEIYCYVDKDNTSAIAFYKKIAKVNTDNLTRYGYYVTLYKKGSTNESVSILPQDTGITTVIFDLGDVLVKSNMMEDLKNKYKFSNYDIKTILSHWFDDSYDLYDSNTFIETMERVLPDKFKSRIFDIILAFKNISLYPYTEKILSDIKRLGYKIYYFSNWSRWGVELLEDANKLRFLHEYFNGGMFSYETKYKKPHKRFYDIFIQKFKLQKSNVIFFDNKQDNINMGKNFGWTGYVVNENLDQHFYDMISSYTNEASNLPQDTGISTIIFDIGDVLVSTNIKDYLKADPEIPNEIIDELLKLWFLEKDEIDDIMDLDTYREIVNKRMGTEFSKYIPKLFQYNIDCVNAFDYTIPMIRDLKDKGYKVYFLSNWSAWTHDLLIREGKFDFLSMMDGGVFSFSVGYMKPHEEIYKILLNRYKIDPEKAIFFDDKEENIKAAKKLGIKGVVFDKHDSVLVYRSLLVNEIYTLGINHSFLPDFIREYVYDENPIIEFNLGKRINEDKAGREIISRIRNKVLSSENYKKASKLDLSLKCTIENIDSNIVCVLILDGDQSNRDTMEAKNLLSKIRLDISPLVSDIVSKISTGDGDEGCLYFTLDKRKIPKNKPDLLLQEYGTTGGTIVGSNQPDSVYIVNYMQNNVFSGHKEKKRAICKKGMNQMYTTQDGHTVPVDIDDFKENASEITVFKLKEQPLIPYDTIIELANFDNEFYTLLTGDIALDVDSILATDSRFVQEENFFDELDAIKACTESTILGESETTKYPYIKVLTESEYGRPWNYYRDINGVFAMNEITGLRSRSYEDISDIPKPELDLVKRGTVYGITE